MRGDLAAWNNGAGIELEAWVGCVGSFQLAIGYSTVFWPRLVLHEGYILREGFSESALRGFEKQHRGDPRAVEAVMNHLHLADIQHFGCIDASHDKLLYLGKILAEMYSAKLAWQFPERPCVVHLHSPDNEDGELRSREITFWQRAHTKNAA